MAGRAVRASRRYGALAMRAAPAIAQFGPFLAERALRGPRLGPGPFSLEVRAASLAKVICRSYAKSDAALLVEVPADLTDAEEQALVAACEWLAHWGELGVWLAGADLSSVDWIQRWQVRLPESVASIAREISTAPPEGPSARPVVIYPPVAGRPHPGSPAERAVEQALAPLPWAAGRAWNQSYQARPLEPPVRLDLVWRAERCVVEVDGPEHLEPLRMRPIGVETVCCSKTASPLPVFTNAQVARDLAAVVCHIEQLVTARRRAVAEG